MRVRAMLQGRMALLCAGASLWRCRRLHMAWVRSLSRADDDMTRLRWRTAACNLGLGVHATPPGSTRTRPQGVDLGFEYVREAASSCADRVLVT